MAWQHCKRLVIAVYHVTAAWPRAEQFGLVSQCRRAAVSACANIAEGASKRGPAEFARYLDIAHGSLSELDCLIELAEALGFCATHARNGLDAVRREAARTTWGLLNAVRSRSRRK